VGGYFFIKKIKLIIEIFHIYISTLIQTYPFKAINYTTKSWNRNQFLDTKIISYNNN